MRQVSKGKLASQVHKRLWKHFTKQQVLDITNLFVSEGIIQLEKTQEINIKNFICLYLEKSQPRKYYNFWEKRFAISKGRTLMKAKIHAKLLKKIKENTDIIKTFLDEEK